jgi:ribonuclease P protein component
VVRNTVRRRLRHQMAGRMDQIPRGSTVVVRALPGAAAASSASMDADLERALANAFKRARSR